MKFLLDQGLPQSAVPRLVAAGHDCVHVAQLAMATATDEQILASALERGATVVTIDADFHALLALSGAIAPSVIRLRVQGLGADALVQLIRSVVAACEADLDAGAVVTADTNRARVRRLPLVP